MRWRWQQEQCPNDPWTNMAVDEAALTSLCEGRDLFPIVRVYLWDRPSVSIGRLQSEEAARRLHPDLPLVRRPTGGRAVLHGEDLTISVAARCEWLSNESAFGILPSYRQIMSGLIAALSDCGIPTAYANVRSARQSAHIVNCFDIASACDLVDRRTGRKIVGSAQRRERDVILQQMSLPLAILGEKLFFMERLQAGFQSALRVKEWILI